MALSVIDIVWFRGLLRCISRRERGMSTRMDRRESRERGREREGGRDVDRLASADGDEWIPIYMCCPKHFSSRWNEEC